jgi:hypothetical protein
MITNKIASAAQQFGLNDVFLGVDLPIHSEVLIPFEGCCGNGFCRPRLTILCPSRIAAGSIRFSRRKTITWRGPERNITSLYLRHSTDTYCRSKQRRSLKRRLNIMQNSTVCDFSGSGMVLVGKDTNRK